MKYRKTITVICLLLIPILETALRFVRVPTYVSMEKAFRQAETAAMVGPAEIIATIDGGRYRSDLITARTDYGVMIYERNRLTYRKMGDAPVIIVDDLLSNGYQDESLMPVFLFHKCQGAATAKLEMTVHSRDESFAKTYLLESDTTYDGLFRFTIRVPSIPETNEERNALRDFRDYFFVFQNDSLTETVPATVWFYDSEGKLLETYAITIRTIAGEAHAERNDLP